VEIAGLSLGDITGGDVEGIRTGAIGDPTVGQVAAPAAGFGVELAYLLHRGDPVFGVELMDALRDETVREATREISRLPERERRLVLGIVRQFGASSDLPSG
jgi:hypothetical protein